MVTTEQIKSLGDRLETLLVCLDIEGKRAKVRQLELKTQAPDFWNDAKAAEAFMKSMNSVKAWVTAYDSAASALDDLGVLYEFAKDSHSAEGDEAVETAEDKELQEAFTAAEKQIEELEIKNMLGEEGDNLGAILTINSGAGGTESNDWSAMLMRMYTRWGERNGMKMTVTELVDGDEAGIHHHRVRRRVCLRLPEGRKRRSSACKNIALQCSGQEADHLFVGLCLSSCR